MIGGNTEAMLQRRTGSETNGIGERIQNWSDVQKLWGWLDLSSGDSKYTYDAKLQESTHIFITDYVPIDRKPIDKRIVVNGVVYDVLFIDDPMELHQHLEIYLKFVG
jgi:SPP1 family predicted phage head-tail adaptor